MTEITWIKLRTDMFNDEKIRLIEKMPEGDSILVIWVKLLAHAGKMNCNGYIMVSENIPMNVEEMSVIFDRPLNTVRLAIEALKRYRMIEIDDNQIISISNWEKHQNIDGMDKIRLQNAERNRKYREKKKQLALPDSDVSVTSRDGTDIDIDKEKEKDIKTLPQQVEAIDWDDLFDQFYSMYPKKVNKKKAFDKFKLKYKKHGLETIMKGTASYAKVMELNQQDKQYIKGPDVFLNGEHYLDDHSELLKKKPNQQMAYKPWEEEFNNGYPTNSYANENNRTELPGTTKQIGW